MAAPCLTQATPPDTVRLTDKTLTHLETLMAASVRRAIHEALTEETAEAFWVAGVRSGAIAPTLAAWGGFVAQIRAALGLGL